MSEPDNALIQWGRVTLDWTPPDVFVLTVPIWLDERGSALFGNELRTIIDALNDLHPGRYARDYDEDSEEVVQDHDFDPGSRTQNARGADSEPAMLRLWTTRNIFLIKPERLRAVLDEVATRCDSRAEEARASDEGLARGWLDRLRAQNLSN